LEHEKGFHILIDALALAIKQKPNIRAKIFGEGSEFPHLQKQISTLGLQDKIRLAGFTSNLSAALAHADLAVSPSFREGISNFILESWSAGVPIIATAIEGSAEIVHDNIRGKLVPPGDVEQMSDAILFAFRNPDARAQWIEGGKKAVEEVHNWERMGEKMEEFMKDLKLET
jgi:glycosyltransferase involved in cell wall biosynthesis